MSSKPTSQESRLPLSQITNDTIFRVSKFVDGEWKNFYIKESDEASWILERLTVPPLSIQAQSDWSTTDPTLISFIKNKDTVVTVASARALAAAGQFDPNMWYIIPNPMSSFGVLRIRARDASNLESKGTLIKGGVAYDVNYVLDDGFGSDGFSYLFDSLNQNLLLQYPDGTDGILSRIPFDQTYYNNEIRGGTYVLSDTTKVTINDCNITTCVVTLDDNGSIAPTGASLVNVVAFGAGTITASGDSGGGSSIIDGLILEKNCAVYALNGSNITECTICHGSSLTVDDNGADNTTSASRIFLDGNTLLNVTGISGGVGTILNVCEVTGMGGTVTIAGGENYQGKILNKQVSTFNGSRTIAADGAYSFIDSALIANYNRSFQGIWTIDSAVPHDVTSFTDRTTLFEHNITFILAAGSATITFKDNGTDIIMKGSVDAPLANEGDYVTFKYVGQVAYEVDRGIY